MMADTEEDSSTDEDDVPVARCSRNPRGPKNRECGAILWGHEASRQRGCVTYKSVTIGDEKVIPGDVILIEADDTSKDPHIGMIFSLFETDDDGEPMCHILWMYYGRHTILGEVSKPNQLFLSTDECQDISLDSFLQRLNVVRVTGDHLDDSHVRYSPDDPKLYFLEFL
jgi:hypothetical protein